MDRPKQKVRRLVNLRKAYLDASASFTLPSHFPQLDIQFCALAVLDFNTGNTVAALVRRAQESCSKGKRSQRYRRQHEGHWVETAVGRVLSSCGTRGAEVEEVGGCVRVQDLDTPSQYRKYAARGFAPHP